MWCTLRESDQTLKNNLRTLDVKLKRTRNKPLSWKLVQPKDKTLTYRVKWGTSFPAVRTTMNSRLVKPNNCCIGDHSRANSCGFEFLYTFTWRTHTSCLTVKSVSREKGCLSNMVKEVIFVKRTNLSLVEFSSRLHLFLKTQQIRNFIPTQNHLDFLLAYKSSNR